MVEDAHSLDPERKRRRKKSEKTHGLRECAKNQGKKSQKSRGAVGERKRQIDIGLREELTAGKKIRKTVEKKGSPRPSKLTAPPKHMEKEDYRDS